MTTSDTGPMFIVSDDTAANEAVRTAHAAYLAADADYQTASEAHRSAYLTYTRDDFGTDCANARAYHTTWAVLGRAFDAREAARAAWSDAFYALSRA
jgi:hypothetical protein